MSFSRYDEHGARTSHHMHRCIGARRATHYATGDDQIWYVLVLIFVLHNKTVCVCMNARDEKVCSIRQFDLYTYVTASE